MKCPYCGEEMRLGYIQSRDRVAWDEKKKMVTAFSPTKTATVDLATEGSLFGGVSAEAYLCVDCKKVIIDYA